jgi:hypothetical protein
MNAVADWSCNGPMLTGGRPVSALSAASPLLVWRLRACFLGFSLRREKWQFLPAKAERGA